MIIKSTDYEGAVKTLASFLDEKSGLDPNRILNADSIRGTDLSEMISSSQSYSPNAGGVFMLFELIENQNDEHFATTGSAQDSMMTIRSLDFHLMIYGNRSPDFAQRMFALFKSGDNAVALREEGVFVNGVESVEAINEFVNNTLLLRRDLIVKIQIRTDVLGAGEDVGEFEAPVPDWLVVQKISGN